MADTPAPGGDGRPAPIRLLIVDDHPVVRDGLRGMFAGSDEFDVVGEASDGVSAVARAAALRPDVVLMDLRMPGGDGVSAISRMSEQKLEARGRIQAVSAIPR